jgi:serine protease Do
MNNRRLLYLALIIATLSIGVVIGTIVSGGARAGEQKPAPVIIPDPVSLSNVFSQIAAQLDPAVVNISTEAAIEQTTRRGGRGGGRQSDPFGLFDFFGNTPDTPERATSVGTGFVVDKAGYILTNQHVIDKATKITVRLDDKSEYTAKVIGSDLETDLAVIKIEAGRELATARMGNSDPVKVGDWVLAIGSPFNFDHTVTAGIVSAKGREGLGGNGPSRGQFQSFIQTDAAINPGNSGGPLVNMAGEVIGVNTAIISETRTFSGLGFALPSNIAIKIYNQLVQSGKVTRGAIGITYLEDPALKRAFGVKNNEGVVVQDVTSGKPAAKAGIRPGDIILEIDGRKTPSGSVLLDIVANQPIGKTVQLKLNRDGREMTIPIIIMDREDVVLQETVSTDRARPGDNQGAEASLGLRVAPITDDQVRRLGLPSADGVMITSVERNSVADDAGLDQGFVITRVQIPGSRRIDIKTMDDFRQAEKMLKSGMEVAFGVLRPDPRTNVYGNAFIAIRVP